MACEHEENAVGEKREGEDGAKSIFGFFGRL